MWNPTGLQEMLQPVSYRFQDDDRKLTQYDMYG